MILQTPLLGEEVYYDIMRRFPERFDNERVRKTIAAGSMAPKVELFKLGSSDEPFLEKAEILELMEAIWRHATYIKWQKDDIIIIDNMNMAHARMNTSGKRTIVASMANRLK